MNFDKYKTKDAMRYLRNWSIFGFLISFLGVTTPYTGEADINWSYFPSSLVSSMLYSTACFVVFMYLQERAASKKEEESKVVNDVLIRAFISTLIVKFATFIFFFLVGLITG
jgi:uncharacterized membrane protein